MVRLPRKQRETGLYGPVWTTINQMIDYCRAITTTGGRGVRVASTMNGTLISVDTERSRSTPIRQFLVNSIQNDFYTCFEWDGSSPGNEQVYVARPFEHRVSNFNGRTIAYNSDGDAFSATYAYSSATRRTKTIAGVAETQVLVPLFKTGFSVIYAIEVSDPLTSGASFQTITDPNGAPITLLDLNVDGRAWAEV
jgi:hypothetical protein